jgi:hypothetical protein
VKPHRAPYGILVDADMSVPSARTSVHISQSMLEAATSIQGVLLVRDDDATKDAPDDAVSDSTTLRLLRRLKLRREPVVIDLDIRH